MGSPRRRKYGERLGGAPSQNYPYVRSVRMAAEMATANQTPRCPICRPTARERASRSKKFVHVRQDPECKARDYVRKQGPVPALLPGAGQRTIPPSLWGAQASLAIRRFRLSPGSSPQTSPRASTGASAIAVSQRGSSGETRTEHPDRRVEDPGSLTVATVAAEAAAAADDPWVNLKEEDALEDPAAVDHEVAISGRELPTAAPRNIAQTIIHPVVVKAAATLRLALGNTCDGAAAHGSNPQICATVRVADPWSTPDAARWALHGVNVYYLAWDRIVPTAWLPNRTVPCVTPGCDGVTAITRYGVSKNANVEPGGLRPILRSDGMFDYVCGVNRKCQKCHMCGWDFESEVVKRLPSFAQQLLPFLPHAANKGGCVILSRELTLAMRVQAGVSMSQWAKSLKDQACITYATRERSFLAMCRSLDPIGLKDIAAAYPTMESLGLASVSAQLLGDRWQEDFNTRATYRQRELQAVICDETNPAMAFDVTHAVPGKIQGVTQAATFVAGDGQVMNVVFVESDAYEHKRLALQDIADRPGCDITLVSYDTCPANQQDVLEDSRATAVGPDLLHEIRNIVSKCNNWNPLYGELCAKLTDAYMVPDQRDIDIIDSKLVLGHIKADVKVSGDILVRKETAISIHEIAKMKNSGAYFKAFDDNIRRQYRPPAIIAAKLKHLKDDMMRREKEANAADNNETITRARGDSLAADVAAGKLHAKSMFSPDALRAFDRAISRAHLYVLPDGLDPHVRIKEEDRFGLPVYRCHGRGSVNAETLHGVMIEWISGTTVSRERGVAQLLDNAAIYNHRIRERLGKTWGVGNLTDWWLAEETNKACLAMGIPLRYPELKEIAEMRHERTGIVAPSVHGNVGFTTSGALKRKERAEVTVAKRQRLQDASASSPRIATDSVMTHARAAVAAFGKIFSRRGLQLQGSQAQASDVEQAGDTAAEETPTDDTGIEQVCNGVAVPASPRSSPRLVEQSRRRTATELEQNRQDALRRRRESAASTVEYVQLRLPAPPPPGQPRGVVVPPAAAGPREVYAVLEQCPEGTYSGSQNAAKRYLRDKGIECTLGCPALQQIGAGRRYHSAGCVYDLCYKKLTRKTR